MPVLPYFPIPIYVHDTYEDPDEYNSIQKELNSVCEKIKWEKLENRPDSSHLLSPSAFNNNVLKQYNCKKFINFLHKHVMLYIGTFDNPMFNITKEYIIDSAWLTNTKKGQHALQHTHGPTDISGVYYIETNGKDGNLFFQDPHSDKVGNLIMDLCCGTTSSEMPLKQGIIMMWPGFMGHGTRDNKTDSTRISLSFNLMFSRRGFTIKDNVIDSERAYVKREKGWKDKKCY
tara:strand:+ start:225 stop:917 length:693 start_codon:yes stop_codon:yes gene_type:complete